MLCASSNAAQRRWGNTRSLTSVASALQRIGEATGGDAYSAVDENDLQTVLFDALRQRG